MHSKGYDLLPIGARHVAAGTDREVGSSPTPSPGGAGVAGVGGAGSIVDAGGHAEEFVGQLGDVEVEVELVGEGEEVVGKADLGLRVGEEGFLDAVVEIAVQRGAELGVGLGVGGLVEGFAQEGAAGVVGGGAGEVEGGGCGGAGFAGGVGGLELFAGDVDGAHGLVGGAAEVVELAVASVSGGLGEGAGDGVHGWGG